MSNPLLPVARCLLDTLQASSSHLPTTLSLPDRWFLTPLHRALERGDGDMEDLLKEYGADELDRGEEARRPVSKKIEKTECM